MKFTSDDVRSAGAALLEQGRAAMGEMTTDARKPLLAVVGAGELAVSQLREQLGDLHDWPAGTQAHVRRLSDRVAGLGARVRDLDPSAVRANVETYLTQARSLYESLAERGEQVIARRTGQPAPAEPVAELTTDLAPGAAPGAGPGSAGTTATDTETAEPTTATDQVTGQVTDQATEQSTDRPDDAGATDQPYSGA